jgi:hypothetical protein
VATPLRSVKSAKVYMKSLRSLLSHSCSSFFDSARSLLKTSRSLRRPSSGSRGWVPEGGQIRFHHFGSVSFRSLRRGKGAGRGLACQWNKRNIAWCLARHCERSVIVECRSAHYLNRSHAIEVAHMHQRIRRSPVVIAIILAVVGQAAILLNDFGPGKGSGSSNMITAAAVARAGAIEIPVGPRNHSSDNGMIKSAPVARVGAIEIPVGPGDHPHGSGMVTTAPVIRTGAIETPTGP